MTRRTLFAAVAAAFVPKPKVALRSSPVRPLASLYPKGKIGQTIMVRKPQRFIAKETLALLQDNLRVAEVVTKNAARLDLEFLKGDSWDVKK